MNIDEAVTFARENHRAILATHRRDGDPQLSPVVIGVDDRGRVMISTREPAIKVANIRRDDRVSVCVVSDGFFGAWVQIDGTAEIVTLDSAMELLDTIYRQVQGEHPDWDEFHRAMVDQRRVVLRITPTAAGPNVSG